MSMQAKLQFRYRAAQVWAVLSVVALLWLLHLSREGQREHDANLRVIDALRKDFARQTEFGEQLLNKAQERLQQLKKSSGTDASPSAAPSPPGP